MKTKPFHWLDFVLWPLLKIFWERFSLKKSHWWHWRDYSDHRNEIIESSKFVLAQGDEDAEPADTFWSNFWQRNFGWQKIVILAAFTKKDKPAKKFRIGYTDGEVCELCSIVLNNATAVLIGPRDCIYFAVDLRGNLLRCQLLDDSKKKSKKFSKEEYIKRAIII